MKTFLVSLVVALMVLVTAGPFLGAQARTLNLVSGSTTVTESGVYRLAGDQTGALVVDVVGPGTVTLELAGARWTSPGGPALTVSSATPVVLVLVAGTENRIADSPDARKLDAALASVSDLAVRGSGALRLEGRFGDAVSVKGRLAFEGPGRWEVSARGHGLEAGVLAVEGGALVVRAGRKGLKAEDDFVVSGGSLEVEADDDALQSEGSGTIRGGQLVLTANGEGQGIKVGGEGTLWVSGTPSVTVTRSREGLAGGHLDLAGGTLKVRSWEDGLSVSRGGDSNRDDGSTLRIAGGSLWIEADGDGIDVNGSGEISGGTVVVWGPPGGGNSALDNNGPLRFSGGVMLAFGAPPRGAPVLTGPQALSRLRFSGLVEGQMVTLRGAAELGRWISPRAYVSGLIVVSHPGLAPGQAYELALGTQILRGVAGQPSNF